MDAGIIASFKRRQRHRQLQHALDLEEQGSQVNIFMVDQLTVMKWIKSCWREVPSEAVLNCFRHTGLVLGHTTMRRSRIDSDKQLNSSLLAQMRQMRIRDPMDQDDFIRCADEAEAEMEAFTAADLLSEDVDVAFLSTAQDSSDDDESAESGPMSEGVSSARPEFSTGGKVDASWSTTPDLQQREISIREPAPVVETSWIFSEHEFTDDIRTLLSVRSLSDLPSATEPTGETPPLVSTKTMSNVHTSRTALRKLDFGACDKRFASTTAFSDLAGESLSSSIKNLRAWLKDQRPLSDNLNLRIQLHLQKIYCECKRSGAGSEQAAESRVELLTYLKYELTKHHFGKFPTPEIEIVFRRLEALCTERVDVPDWFLPPYELRSSIRYSTTAVPTIDSKGKMLWRTSRAWARRALMDEFNTRELFVQDMSRWFQLKHPNVEQLLGACHVGERFFLSRECGNSKELWAVLINPYDDWYAYKKKVIAHSMAWQMLYGAALGLQFLHDRDIAHGNLKGNVVIPDGNIVKIRGFFWGKSRNERRDSTKRGSCSELSPFASDIRDFGWCILEAINGPQNLAYNCKNASWEPVKTPQWEWSPSNHPANFSDSQWQFLKTLVCEGSQERVTITEVVRLLKVFAREEEVYGRRRLGARQLLAAECEHVAQYIVPSKQKPIRLLLDFIKTNLTNYAATSPATASTNMQVFRRLSNVYLEMTRMSMSRIAQTNMLARYCHILERFYDIVTAKSRTSSAIVHLASSRARSESNYELNLDLDQLCTVGDLSPDTRDCSWRIQCKEDHKMRIKLLSTSIHEQMQSTQDVGDSSKVRDECLAYLLFEHGQRRSRYSAAELGDLERAIKAIPQGLTSTDPPWFIPPYEVEVDETLFQSGGFGLVYEGKWLDAAVIVKTLRHDDVQSHQSFFNEVDIWYQLNHPNVVKLFGACHVNKPFFVCEFAVNGQLDTHLNAEDKGSRPNRSYTWHRLCDAASGLKYLHGRGIVHGDLKCDNILVGTDGLAKLTDFGLSTFKFDANSSAKKTGAVRWVAPEVLMGGSPTFASDVYSFGMCVIEAVSGERPWRSADDVYVKLKVKRGYMPDRPKRFQDDERLWYTDRAWEIVQQMCCSVSEKRLEMEKVVDSMTSLSKSKSRILRRPHRTSKQSEIP